MSEPDRITVLGEVVVDLVARPDGALQPIPGGSPANVAVALARLGQPVDLLARLGADALGARCRAHLAGNGVGLERAVAAPQPSTLALVTVGADGQPRYDFWTEGTSDWQWSDDELADAPGPQARALHTGSVASWYGPGATSVLGLLRRTRAADRCTVSYDPNVRPALLGPPDWARAVVAERVAAAHLVKASDEDLAWLHPGEDPEAVAASWLALGPQVVVVTRGSRGPVAIRAAGRVERPAPKVDVVDTVGAGDTFSAGLLAALAAADALGPQPAARLAALSDAHWAAILDTAAAAAALTCTRAGCDPPTSAEVTALLRRTAATG